MNMERHVRAQMDLYKALAKGEQAQARTIKDFYDEYFAVLDMTAEFYLETVQRVFQEHLLARGVLEWKGRRVHPKAIRRTALFTVEGERDDICSIGQTVAAHDLCSSLRPYRKKHYMQAGVGHYGVFSGRRWAGQIYPLVRNTILANE
jgi:polyhydroxyalkanoate depolymerase